MRWAEITIEATEASADAATNIMIEEGCGGTASREQADTVSVTGYLPVDDRLEGKLTSIRERVRLLPELGLVLISPELSIKWVEDDDWATAWKKYFKPIRFGRIVVKPSWEEFEPGPDDVIVEIDPGMAFGTGNHPTTALCLMLLQELVTGGEIVLDVGTGSGILAIAAAKLGASHVTGLDYDPVAVEAAIRNVEMSGLSDRIDIREADNPSAFDGKAELVIANIIPNVIIGMASDLAAKVKPGGKLVTSGIVIERADEVRTALEQQSLIFKDQRVDGDWVALVHEKADF